MLIFRGQIFPRQSAPTRRGCRGLTLVEIMIASGISLFIVMVFVGLLSSTRSSWLVSQVQTDLYLEGRKAAQTIFRELVESSSGRCDMFMFIDPINGQYRQGLWFASGRGDPALGQDYVHFNADNVVEWRSVVVICPMVTPEGDVQLRRYVDYGSDSAYYAGGNIFPLTLVSVTPNNLMFAENNGNVITIDRHGGSVLANYLATEDANNNNVLDVNENDGLASLPPDNADGFLNLGANFILSSGRVDIILFLSREVTALSQAGRFLVSTVRTSVKLRQP